MDSLTAQNTKVKKLWEVCISCKINCCESEVATVIYLTPQEKINLPEIDFKVPCAYLNGKKLCSVHKSKPFDCRIWPFDIMKRGDVFFWIIWHSNCPILTEERFRFESYLKDLEKNVIPTFKNYIDDNNKFACDNEYKLKYQYEILRELSLDD